MSNCPRPLYLQCVKFQLFVYIYSLLAVWICKLELELFFHRKYSLDTVNDVDGEEEVEVGVVPIVKVNDEGGTPCEEEG